MKSVQQAQVRLSSEVEQLEQERKDIDAEVEQINKTLANFDAELAVKKQQVDKYAFFFVPC